MLVSAAKRNDKLLKGRGTYFLVPMFSFGDAETRNSILKNLEYTKVIKWYVCCQNKARMHIIPVMVFPFAVLLIKISHEVPTMEHSKFL